MAKKKALTIDDIPLKPRAATAKLILDLREKYFHLIEDQVNDLQKLHKPMDRIIARDRIMSYIFAKPKAVELTVEGGAKPLSVVVPTQAQLDAAIDRAKKETGKGE